MWTMIRSSSWPPALLPGWRWRNRLNTRASDTGILETHHANMTLEQQIGQMLWLGWQNEQPEPPAELPLQARALLEEFDVGGAILMGRNVRDPRQVAELTSSLQERAATP